MIAKAPKGMMEARSPLPCPPLTLIVLEALTYHEATLRQILSDLGYERKSRYQ